MRVIGIDPGLATIGLGLLEGSAATPVALDWCCITTEAGVPPAQRLAELQRDLQEYLGKHKPEIAVVERVFFSVNVKTAIDVAQARGVILSTLAHEGVGVVEVGPAEIKSAIAGDGKADKQQMNDMVVRTLKLSSIPTPDDAADALALALYGLISQKQCVM